MNLSKLPNIWMLCMAFAISFSSLIMSVKTMGDLTLQKYKIKYLEEEVYKNNNNKNIYIELGWKYVDKDDPLKEDEYYVIPIKIKGNYVQYKYFSNKIDSYILDSCKIRTFLNMYKKKD